MPLIDERGRLFGRINLIDAGMIGVALVLIPIAYTGFLLFRTPAPHVTAIEPGEVPLGQEMRVKVKGTGLRPLFRAFIGEMPASAYLYENEASADVLFSRVTPGRYDLSLFDGVQEVARVKNAVTILVPVTPPVTKIRMTGLLIALNDEAVRKLTTGQRFPPAGSAESEILTLGKPRPDVRWVKAADTNIALTVSGAVQVPVLVRTECQMLDTGDCRIGGVSVGARAIVLLPGSDGAMRLMIDDVRPDEASQPADVVVRLVTRPELADLIKVGDGDDPMAIDAAHAATVTAILGKQFVSGERSMRSTESADVLVESKTPDRFTSSDIVLHMGLDRAPGGWRYRGQVIRVGAPFAFATDSYSVRGAIQRVTLRASQTSAPARTGE